MLTGYQCEVVAYTVDESGSIICRECAVKRTSSITIDKAELGLTTSVKVDQWIRYSLDELSAERWSEHCADCGKKLG
jgi:hypothetical protein